MVLERAGASQTLQLFSPWYSQCPYHLPVEHAGAARGQFATMRGIRQGCTTSGGFLTLTTGV